MGRDEDGIIDNLQYICQAAVNNKTIPVIATLTPACGPYRGLASGIERVNANIRLMAAAINVTVVDLEAAFNWAPVYLQSDGLHPTAQGYELMARTFYDVVN
jgi:lysophospholipase L1-like esterase